MAGELVVAVLAVDVGLAVLCQTEYSAGLAPGAVASSFDTPSRVVVASYLKVEAEFEPFVARLVD